MIRLLRIPTAGALALGIIAVAGLQAEEWSRFRGPNGSGVGTARGLPTEFAPGVNEIWGTEIPFGRSSPAIGKDRIFLTAVEDDKLLTLAIDRASGKQLWTQSIERGHTADLYDETDSATPTPSTDGTNVYVLFHEFGLLSYTADGTLRWKLELGPFRNYYGLVASPLLAGNAVIVVCDQAGGSFLTAVDKTSGKVLWQRERPARLEAYATPVLYPNADEPTQIVVVGSRFLDAYNLATGETVWSHKGVSSGPIASPVLEGDTLYFVGIDHAEDGWPEFAGLLEKHDANADGQLSRAEVEGVWLHNHFPWLDPDGSGQISAKDWQHMANELENDQWGAFAVQLPKTPQDQPKVLWNYRQNVSYIPSPLIYDGIFYMIKDGFVSSLDPASGELIKRGRLNAGSPKVYASPVAADDKVFVSTLKGTVVVLEPGNSDSKNQWQVVASNELGEQIWATPALADDSLYLRTKSHLYRFGTPEAKPVTQEEPEPTGEL